MALPGEQPQGRGVGMNGNLHQTIDDSKGAAFLWLNRAR